jgi:hypothetical protein
MGMTTKKKKRKPKRCKECYENLGYPECQKPWHPVTRGTQLNGHERSGIINEAPFWFYNFVEDDLHESEVEELYSWLEWLAGGGRLTLSFPPT